eukprot:gene14899-4427_t
MDLLLKSIVALLKRGGDGTVVLAHKDRERSKTERLTIFNDLEELFCEHECVKVLDETRPGTTGGDLTESEGMWIHVYR